MVVPTVTAIETPVGRIVGESGEAAHGVIDGNVDSSPTPRGRIILVVERCRMHHVALQCVQHPSSHKYTGIEAIGKGFYLPCIESVESDGVDPSQHYTHMFVLMRHIYTMGMSHP